MAERGYTIPAWRRRCQRPAPSGAWTQGRPAGPAAEEGVLSRNDWASEPGGSVAPGWPYYPREWRGVAVGSVVGRHFWRCCHVGASVRRAVPRRFHASVGGSGWRRS